MDSREENDKIARRLLAAIGARSAKVAVIGLGYVGLPLATSIAHAGFVTTGFDIDPSKINLIRSGKAYIDAVTDNDLVELTQKNVLSATSDFANISSNDIVVICVPTPLTPHREPDLSFVERTSKVISDNLRRGHLVILESTSFPGTTLEFVKPILETSGLTSGKDFFLGFSPEREDPGNQKFNTTTIPKVVSGDGRDAHDLVMQFYKTVVKSVVPVSSPSVAEAVKLTENVFRAVNIALVNELKIIYGAMGIDVWEVIDAAASKPFGYMPFYPGPGLGGHCIPIDPFYLTWKAKEFEVPTRFIELAGEINVAMPTYVVAKLESALDHKFRKSLGSSRVLLLGLAYKRNVADIRESPSLRLMHLLESRGATVEYHDPHVPEIRETREYKMFKGRKSTPIDESTIGSYDAIIVSTDHDQIDYALIAKNGRLIVDTRNVFERNGLRNNNVVKA